MGATNDDLAGWINRHSKVTNPGGVLKWNNRMRDIKLSEMSLPSGVCLV
ncbi:MAG: hypothetical protein P0111_01325 [Nitrospira sp.]|nr:hypothetical protein [Nitrospira sp.]